MTHRGVYVISDEAETTTKVGVAANARHRLKELQVGHPRDLFLIAWWMVPDAERIEAAVHAELAAKRLRGEWFAVSGLEAVLAFGIVCGRLGVKPENPPVLVISESEGSPLYRWRIERNMSAANLADQVGVHQAVISRIENGVRRPSLKVERALMGITGLSHDDLIQPLLTTMRQEGEAA